MTAASRSVKERLVRISHRLQSNPHTREDAHDDERAACTAGERE